MPSLHLTLLIPDLSRALSQTGTSHIPLLERICRRANIVLGDQTGLLAGLFGLRTDKLAVAPFTRLADGGLRDGGFWWRADPVHLMADRDQLVMLPPETLAISSDEAYALTDTLNHHFESDSLRFEMRHPRRWYLRSAADWQCHTWPSEEVVGHSLDSLLPKGAQGRKLRQLMNDIQMLFYEHPVNRARTAAGQLAINSLWLWGGGCLPNIKVTPPARIVSSLPLVKGLAQFVGSEAESWPIRVDSVAGTGEMLVALMLTDFDNDGARFEKELLMPAWQALRVGAIHELRLHQGGDHFFVLTRWNSYRFWRRQRSRPGTR